jgi:hypothetical protein
VIKKTGIVPELALPRKIMSHTFSTHLEHVDGKAPVFTDPVLALNYGARFASAEFTDEALTLRPELGPLRGKRIPVSAYQVVRNVKYGKDELLFQVSAPGQPDWLVYGGTYFARALTNLSTKGVEVESAAQPLQVVYLANATGDITGYGTSNVTEADLNKVPFLGGPGGVWPCLTEISGKKYVQGNLEVAFQDAFWGDDQDELKPQEEVRQYCKAVQAFITPRLTGGAILLDLDERDPGRIIVRVAVPLETVANSDDALRKLGALFGTTANLVDPADFADLPA